MRFILALAAALAFFPFTASAATEVRSPDGSSAAITFDAVTMTTAVDATAPVTGTYDLRLYKSLTCEVSATAGDARSVIPKCYAEKSGTTLTFTYPTMTVNGLASPATGRYVFDPLTSAATGDTNVTDSPNLPCAFLKITAASAGPGTISCTARR